MNGVIELSVGSYMAPSRTYPGYYALLTIDERELVPVRCSCDNGQAAAKVGKSPNCHHLVDVTAYLRGKTLVAEAS